MSQPYLSLEAMLHDAFWDAEDDGSEVRLMADFLKCHPGPALEIGSGSGRLMFPLLQQGFNVEGLELSPDMIAYGEMRAQRMAVKPIVHFGDMTEWREEHRYDNILAPAFTLQLAENPEATLRHWHGLMKSHAAIYLTVFMPYAELLGDLPENKWYPDHQAKLPDGRTGSLETRHHLDHQTRLLHRDHRYTIDENPPIHHNSQQKIRWIEHREMLDLLQNTGYRMDRFFLDFDPHLSPRDPDLVDFDGILTYHATRLA